MTIMRDMIIGIFISWSFDLEDGSWLALDVLGAEDSG
jgi:hypothetical protein